MYFAIKNLQQIIVVSIADTCCIADEQFLFYYILNKLIIKQLNFWHCIGIGCPYYLFVVVKFGVFCIGKY